MAAVGDEAYERCLEYADGESAKLVTLNRKDDFQKTMPGAILQGDFTDWRGFWKAKGAGWVFASGAIEAMHDEAERLGVHFVTGVFVGKVDELLLTHNKDTVRGAKTADGTLHVSDQTILSAGASSDLLLDFEKQLRPTAWTLAHLPLSAEEAKAYQALPVLYGVDRGFFIEPDLEKHEMKLCDEHPGYLNPAVKSNGELRSVPVARNQIPKEAEIRMRRLLSETMPQFVGRAFSFARICWDADTIDRIFLIDQYPKLQHLTVAVGGSGNGFMACPAVGLFVADLIEGKTDERLRKMMRWRPEICVDRDWWDTQGRYGGDRKVMDLRDVKDWTSIGV